MYEPSVRRIGFAMRTTTARTTSPFLTALFGMACLIEHTTTSPTVAYRRVVPPRARIPPSSPAPPFSPTFSPVVSWDFSPSPNHFPHAPPSLYLTAAHLLSTTPLPVAP